MSMLSKLEENIPSLRRYAWSLLRQSSDADDLVQDCLVRALDRIETVRAEGDLRPWLFAIMHNLYVSRWRRMKRRPEVAAADVEAELAMQAAQPASAEMRLALRGLAQLPEDQRRVILLVAVEGFQYDEVARMLGIPIGTVMSRLSRARDKLRELVEGRERPQLRRVK
jgi:RNA polymerase sigma-70 factor (ECF subfamily)